MEARALFANGLPGCGSCVPTTRQSKGSQVCHSKAEHNQRLTNLLCSAAKFNGVHSVDLHIPSNFGADQTEIHFIGFKGEYTQVGLVNHASLSPCHLWCPQFPLSKADCSTRGTLWLHAPTQAWTTFARKTCGGPFQATYQSLQTDLFSTAHCMAPCPNADLVQSCRVCNPVRHQGTALSN